MVIEAHRKGGQGVLGQNLGTSNANVVVRNVVDLGVAANPYRRLLSVIFRRRVSPRATNPVTAGLAWN
jgi:hypothetical protein